MAPPNYIGGVLCHEGDKKGRPQAAFFLTSGALGLRHARYRGRARVWYQSLLTGFVVNLKRLVRLLSALGETAAGTVRAEAVALS